MLHWLLVIDTETVKKGSKWQVQVRQWGFCHMMLKPKSTAVEAKGLTALDLADPHSEQDNLLSQEVNFRFDYENTYSKWKDE